MFKSKLELKKIYNIYRRHYSGLVNIANILQHNNIGDSVQIKGWIKSIRKMKANIFFDVSDGSCEESLQVIISQSLKLKELTTGCSVVASGSLNRAPKGHLELQANELQVLSKSMLPEGYPFLPKKTYSSDYLRQYLHLRPRTNAFISLLRLRHAVKLAIHEYLHSEGFISIDTPVLTSNDCEGAGELFVVQPDNQELLRHMKKLEIPTEQAFFDSKVLLTVSGQLHLEAAVHGISKVYSFGPTFRAENSRSRLHLSEFYMLEAEIAFLDKVEELCNVTEQLIKAVTSRILNENSQDLHSCQIDNVKPDLSWLEKKFYLITYDEAIDILDRNKTQFKTQFSVSHGFAKEHEIFLVNYFGEVPVFVINWPKVVKPFYMKECADDVSKVAALDLLGPNIGEIVGGSLRENDYSKLRERLPKDRTNLDWYLELRKFGGVPTGGFGLGFERYLQLITGISNIKDTIPFPRWPHNCSL